MRRPTEAAPFRLGPESARIGVVLVHGFTGSPFEMRALGEHLSARGMAVEGPVLAGHGEVGPPLRKTRWPDWLGSVEQAAERLRPRVERLTLCGLSLGALLCLEFARLRPSELSAIALLAPALRLTPAALRFDRLIQRIPGVRSLSLPKMAGSDLGDPEMRARNERAQRGGAMPFSALHSLVLLGEHLQPRLKEITTPALVAHGKNDQTVPFSCLEEVAGGLGSREVRRLELPRSAHVITLDVEREEVYRAVTDHLLCHAGPAGRAQSVE